MAQPVEVETQSVVGQPEKRQRTAALHDAAALNHLLGNFTTSWVAIVLGQRFIR